MARIVAALSGGVDSAVAAARLVEAGHDVTAVHLALLRDPATLRPGARGCCSLADANDARRVADTLGIPFYVWDFSEAFQQAVVDDFVAGYAAGRTPNPCLRCNQTIKFAGLLQRALALGFDGVATGHYARLVHRDDGVVELHRGADKGKDQSYVLGVMTQDGLRHAWFPLGESTKPEVRAEAAARGLRVADKPESMDLCFIPDGDTAGWLAARLGERPGAIVDEAGEVLGAHQGTYHYTIGQRKGLNLRRPAPDGQPRFVVGLDAGAEAVIVGPRQHLAVSALTGTPALWCEGAAPAEPFAATVQVRAHGAEHEALVTPADDGEAGGITVALPSPIIGVAPGQTAVIYDGTRVVGSATITGTTPAASAQTTKSGAM